MQSLACAGATDLSILHCGVVKAEPRKNNAIIVERHREHVPPCFRGQNTKSPQS